MKNVLKLLAKGVLIPLGLTPAASEARAAIQKKGFWSDMTRYVISSKEMDYIMKIVNSSKESVLLIKGVQETIKKEWFC